jgi:hypothetical protein
MKESHSFKSSEYYRCSDTGTCWVRGRKKRMMEREREREREEG